MYFIACFIIDLLTNLVSITKLFANASITKRLSIDVGATTSSVINIFVGASLVVDATITTTYLDIGMATKVCYGATTSTCILNSCLDFVVYFDISCILSKLAY